MEISEPIAPAESAVLVEATPKSERIDQAIVAASAEKLGTFYGLPRERIEAAKNIPAFLVTEEELAARLQVYFGQLREGIRGGKQSDQDEEIVEQLTQLFYGVTRDDIEKIFQDLATKESNELGGIVIEDPNGTRSILVKRKTILSTEEVVDHEMTHCLASRGFLQSSGFKEIAERGNSYYRDLDEAATEILRLAASSSIPLDELDLFSAVVKGEIKCGYQGMVGQFLGLMASSQHTALGDAARVSIKELGKLYFDKDEPIDEKESTLSVKFILTAMSYGSSTVPDGTKKIAETLKSAIDDLFQR